MVADEVDVRIPSHPRWLRFARLLLDECCRDFGVDADTARDIVQAVDEALSNVMRHAYEGDSGQPIRIVCRCDGNEFQVEVCDLGREFDPFAQPVPPPDELRSGGRGIFLIRSLMDGCEYRRADGWNCVRLSKGLPQSADGPRQEEAQGA